MSWFRRTDPVDDGVKEWIADSFCWAIEHGVFRHDTPLVRLTSEFFPASRGATEQDTVEGLVDNLKTLLDLHDRDITLLPIEVLPDELRHSYQSLGEIAGTWQGQAEGSILRYDPTLIRSPATLISTLAHELMHERLSLLPDTKPGGAQAEELSTDLHCITSGLGIIQMTGAESAGWQGYMRQESRAWALALFLRARGLPEVDALSGLPPRSAKMLKTALSSLDKEADIVGRLREALVKWNL